MPFGWVIAWMGTNDVVVWQKSQFVTPPCFVPWHETQRVPAAGRNGLPWHALQASDLWAPVSAKKIEWFQFEATAPVLVWHAVHVLMPWTRPWHPTQLRPVTCAYRLRGWHREHLRRAWGPGDSGKTRE